MSCPSPEDGVAKRSEGHDGARTGPCPDACPPTKHWRGFLRPRLGGLTDEEYLWEPVEGCWSIRAREDATSGHAVGAGDTVRDLAVPDPTPAPVTTIAWRLGHIAIDIFGARASNHFGDGSVDDATTDWPMDAEGGLSLPDEHYGHWRAGALALTEEELLNRAVGPAEGPFAEAPYIELVLHLNREAIHHGAEILLLRDLYRTGSPAPPSSGARTR